MSVGYRSFLHAEPGQHLVDVLIEHLNRWMAEKDINVDAGSPGKYTFSNGNVIVVIEEAHNEGRIYRWTRRHQNAHPRDVLRSTITAAEDRYSRGWLWSEIETQDDDPSSIPTPFSCMSVPRVLRSLLGALSFRDGRTEIAAEPQWVSSRHLPDVMDCLADESRLGPVYVASQGPAAQDRFGHWVTEVTWHLVGMGSVLVLDNAVAAEFNEMVGERHGVPAGTIRTYLPNVNLDDADDPRRHRILGTTRINLSEPRRLAGMLGLAARIRAAQLTLPDEVAELDRLLLHREKEAVPARACASLRAVPLAQDLTEAAILTKLAALEQEIHGLRTALNMRSANGHRQLSAS